MADWNKTTTDFGFKKVPWQEKSGRVAEVFRSVAPKYDVMNDLMSFGLHRFWKQFTLSKTGLRAGLRALDVAGGTGDLAIGLADKVQKNGKVILVDINENMLNQARNRLVDKGLLHTIHCVQADAEKLPFADDEFDCITIAFGLRNVTDKNAALASFYRVLKPGGKLLVLEFSKPVLPFLALAYDAYSFNIIPRLGKFVCGDETSYHYLVESIRMHPDQNTLKNMFIENQFEETEYDNLCGGIVALHTGYKY